MEQGPLLLKGEGWEASDVDEADEVTAAPGTMTLLRFAVDGGPAFPLRYPRPMGRSLESIDDALAAWIAEQALFFVGTAPLDGNGHVNISPKGPIGSLRVLGPRQIAYLDVIGSGAETIAHLRENGRIVIMLCAFSGPPRILRMHGRGTVLPPDDPRAMELLARAAFEDAAIPDARRALVVVDVTRVATSCGFGVPQMTLEGQRPHAADWARKKIEQGGAEALAAYQREKNALSLDGLPAIDWLE